jgi:Lon protease-like protein
MMVTLDLDSPMAVFPLPDCVMIPHTLMPLHIFEDRYRQMTVDSLDSAGIIAMGLFQDDVTQDEYMNGRPALRPYVCVGQIQEYQKTEDGRFVFLLGGICRATIQEEIPNEPYRLVQIKVLHDEPIPTESVAAMRDRLEGLIRDTAMDRFEPIAKMRELLKETEPLEILVDVIFAASIEDPDERYSFLAESNAERRAWQLVRCLKAIRDEQSAG